MKTNICTAKNGKTCFVSWNNHPPFSQVAKSVSLRLYNELEAVQKKNSQLEWENEVLRERTQELEVTKQVLQAEVDKIREVRLKPGSLSVCVCVLLSTTPRIRIT